MQEYRKEQTPRHKAYPRKVHTILNCQSHYTLFILSRLSAQSLRLSFAGGGGSSTANRPTFDFPLPFCWVPSRVNECACCS
jgi:hypothetical protein